jgi:hypothetical protein
MDMVDPELAPAITSVVIQESATAPTQVPVSRQDTPDGKLTPQGEPIAQID